MLGWIVWLTLGRWQGCESRQRMAGVGEADGVRNHGWSVVVRLCHSNWPLILRNNLTVHSLWLARWRRLCKVKPFGEDPSSDSSMAFVCCWIWTRSSWQEFYQHEHFSWRRFRSSRNTYNVFPLPNSCHKWFLLGALRQCRRWPIQPPAVSRAPDDVRFSQPAAQHRVSFFLYFATVFGRSLILYRVQVDIDLPQIAVIGSQSAGKSSLIESISGITLPRAAGTCTRWAVLFSISYELTQTHVKLEVPHGVPSFSLW